MKNLISKLASRFFSTKSSNGYKTIIYPKPGHALVIHDMLDFFPLVANEHLDLLAEFWSIEEIPETHSELIEWPTQNLSFECSSPDINPATGFPMLNDVIDVAGNTFDIASLDNTLGSGII
ncbi:hypothetical protein [Pseudomonas zhanjiangensis]|uniref:Uncharacterized protein n=1 Tax=Pseudomonas zhanjiangensis TaxID=3239015 RepID=A0ABV3Z079_9PSED